MSKQDQASTVSATLKSHGGETYEETYYAFRTNASESYDHPQVVEIMEVSGSGGERIILIPEGVVQWQIDRNLSGMYTTTPEEGVGDYVARKLFTRMVSEEEA